MMTVQERYERDPEFHRLVKQIYMIIEQCQYTPTELREAVMLAAIMHIERRPPVPVTLEKEVTNFLEGKIKIK